MTPETRKPSTGSPITTQRPTTPRPTTTTTTKPITTAKPVNPWAGLWTTTQTTKVSVNVSVLQSGSIRALQDGQMEMVGAITLVNDNGMRVLIDTGSASDTERLLQSRFQKFLAFFNGEFLKTEFSRAAKKWPGDSGPRFQVSRP